MTNEKRGPMQYDQVMGELLEAIRLYRQECETLAHRNKIFALYDELEAMGKNNDER